MEKFREFQGQNLDECISQAMEWFDCPRETLEVDILQDAKSGIFGIVGARKAKIRARRAPVAEAVRDLLGAQDTKAEKETPEEKKKTDAPKASAKPRKKLAREARPAASGLETGEEAAKVEFGAAIGIPDSLEDDEEFSKTPLEDLDREKLAETAVEIVKNLVRPIAGREVAANVDIGRDTPRVKVEWEGDAGLLIGREGQTLAALQYLASRMLSRAMGAPVRLQLDIGEYRARQDEKLRELAKTLAEKVRKTGRPLSTRPLSSYHRRIVHLCLQEEADIQTRSAGEGAMKRVLVMPKRG